MITTIVIPVLKRKKYAVIAAIAVALMAVISYYLMVFNVAYKSIAIYAEMEGFWFTTASLILTLVISVLFGIYLALLFFKIDATKKKSGADAAAGVGGTAASALAAGCPSCGVPLLGLFGAPTALLALPFQGLEIKILSILLLLLSVYLIAESIEKKLRCPL